MSKRSGNAEIVKVDASESMIVGMDVHKQSADVALRCNGSERRVWHMSMDHKAIIASLTPYKKAIKKVVYEAGPTGFALARDLQAEGFPVQVIAPGKTPRVPGRQAKSDRLDCRELAKYAEMNLVHEVAIPSEREEYERGIFRLRCQQTEDLRRAKQRIKSFLLLHHVHEPSGLVRWSKAGMEALKNMTLRVELRYTLDTLVRALEFLINERKQTEAHLREMSKQAGHRDRQCRLRTHPGVGPITAAGFELEVYQPRRFKRAEEMVRYVGLAPGGSKSGLTNRSGPLLKAGRGELRALLIEASWTWIRVDAWAAQTYRRIRQNTGSAKKAIVAMARRMAVNLWCMLCRGQEYKSKTKRAMAVLGV